MSLQKNRNFVIEPPRSKVIGFIYLVTTVFICFVITFFILNAKLERYPVVLVIVLLAGFSLFFILGCLAISHNFTRRILIEQDKQCLKITKKVFPFKWQRTFHASSGGRASCQFRWTPVHLEDSNFFGYGNFKVIIKQGQGQYVLTSGLQKKKAEECVSFINNFFQDCSLKNNG